ncbi:MAG: cag pathogenicity island Cag12 family protein [Sulfurovum sp.]|nr:cag pathogenicity island Cag12 family protein [Sulfurovum sp.]
MIRNLLLIGALFFGACSQKVPMHPIQIEDTPQRVVSLSLINNFKTYVPQDTFLLGKNWHYQQNTYRDRYLFENEEIAGTFYLAHHATHIYIHGSEYNFRKYRDYFLQNQVAGIIKFVPNRRQRRNHVKIDYFHIVGKNDTVIVSKNTTGKNTLKPTCEVVEIPKNFIKEYR